MSNQIKTWLYIISTILVVAIVGVLAIKLLWFLLPVIIILYIIFKIKGYIDRKKSSNSTVNYTKSSYDNKIDDIDNSNAEVIDVDYEDVNK